MAGLVPAIHVFGASRKLRNIAVVAAMLPLTTAEASQKE
jgi:hypothetical protein